MSERRRSIMEAALQESDHVIFYGVDEPVLLRNASGTSSLLVHGATVPAFLSL